jgi:hypothetical protein
VSWPLICSATCGLRTDQNMICLVGNRASFLFWSTDVLCQLNPLDFSNRRDSTPLASHKRGQWTGQFISCSLARDQVRHWRRFTAANTYGVRLAVAARESGDMQATIMQVINFTFSFSFLTLTFLVSFISLPGFRPQSRGAKGSKEIKT